MESSQTGILDSGYGRDALDFASLHISYRLHGSNSFEQMHTGSVLRLLANNAALQVRTKATVLKIQTTTGEGPADSEQPNLGAWLLQLLKEAVSQQRSQHRSSASSLLTIAGLIALGLYVSGTFTGIRLDECIGVIHDDIVNVWNFNDPNHQARPALIVATIVRTNRILQMSPSESSGFVSIAVSSRSKSQSMIWKHLSVHTTIKVIGPAAAVVGLSRLQHSPFQSLWHSEIPQYLMGYVTDMAIASTVKYATFHFRLFGIKDGLEFYVLDPEIQENTEVLRQRPQRYDSPGISYILLTPNIASSASSSVSRLDVQFQSCCSPFLPNVTASMSGAATRLTSRTLSLDLTEKSSLLVDGTCRFCQYSNTFSHVKRSWLTEGTPSLGDAKKDERTSLLNTILISAAPIAPEGTNELAQVFGCSQKWIYSIGFSVQDDIVCPGISNYANSEGEHFFRYWTKKYENIGIGHVPLHSDHQSLRLWHHMNHSKATHQTQVVSGPGWVTVCDGIGFTDPLHSPGTTSGMTTGVFVRDLSPAAIEVKNEEGKAVWSRYDEYFDLTTQNSSITAASVSRFSLLESASCGSSRLPLLLPDTPLERLDGISDAVVEDINRFSEEVRIQAMAENRFPTRWNGLFHDLNRLIACLYHPINCDNNFLSDHFFAPLNPLLQRQNYDEVKNELQDPFMNVCSNPRMWAAVCGDRRKCYTCGIIHPQECDITWNSPFVEWELQFLTKVAPSPISVGQQAIASGDKNKKHDPFLHTVMCMLDSRPHVHKRRTPHFAHRFWRLLRVHGGQPLLRDFLERRRDDRGLCNVHVWKNTVGSSA
ncbi:hypothetical protein BS47DRAFT_1393937 [Hydnum rufescens UP504]|uniref:Uncharacterized protein n=1 Tax=Hydnum rufescens UP504 TaxID=1448309 RepID=A0A9P6DS16_9AGAM|nr:hypothetical protein BS47DRAFT_1393937 [Hydnum rufescens UP504]